MTKRLAGQHTAAMGAVGALATVAATVALALSMTPLPGSVETPAHRCQRETTAYSEAWKAIGKTPPAPFKCGGKNHAPPTSSAKHSTDEPPIASRHHAATISSR